MSETFKVGILGYGEIGRAIAQFYTNPLIRDLDINTFDSNLDVLHICIPYLKNFHDIVAENITTYRPRLVIIHSTIGAGDTKKLFDMFGNVVHSPVRGVHPKLFEGIKTFIKFIGADDPELGERAAEHLRSIGISRVKVCASSVATELGKLFDTTYYGLCIAFHAYAAEICKKFEGVKFDEVMTDFNASYNEGYIELGKTNVIRPVLSAPENGKIGGHCILPNAHILSEVFGEDEILQAILRHE